MSIINFESSGNKTVLFSKVDGVGHITLNRPDRYNGVNHELVEGLIYHLDCVRDDPEVRCVLISGSGRGFCAGADLADFAGVTPEDVGEYIPMFYGTIVRKIITMPKPVLAAIHGSAAGVGTAFALACDMRIMSETANFRYAFINIGLGPDGGAGWLLARTVGYSRAFEIAVGGEKIPAQKCLDLGLTNKIASDDQFCEEALSWAKEMALRPTYAVGITKQALQHAMTNTLMDTTVLEAQNQVGALKSYDHSEGIQAFFQKRKPVFKGK